MSTTSPTSNDAFNRLTKTSICTMAYILLEYTNGSTEYEKDANAYEELPVFITALEQALATHQLPADIADGIQDRLNHGDYFRTAADGSRTATNPAERESILLEELTEACDTLVGESCDHVIRFFQDSLVG